jgi:hypothetical protein
MVMRANPRGSQVGKLDEKQNAVAIPVWGITESVDTIVFRSADPKRRDSPAYDRRIQVAQERRKLANDVEAIVLRPVDEGVDLGRLRREMRGPYVQLSDFYFDGAVAEATHPDYGAHLAMFEIPAADALENPPLRTVISFGFRGPYFYEPGDTGRPPSALIGLEGLDLAVGTVLRLRVDAPPRGADLGSVDQETGEYKTPGWRFLQGTSHAVLRHRQDPELDMLVPVTHRPGEDGTLRFESAAPEVVDFSRAEAMKEFEGPFLVPPPYEFEVEVHTSARLDPKWRERRVLVPIHDLPEPQGGTGDLYDPHPGEVLLSDMRGPFLAREGSVLVADAFERTGGEAAVLALAGLSMLLLLTGATAWTVAAAALVAARFGRAAARPVPFLVAGALVVGAAASLEQVSSVMIPVVLAALSVHVLAQVLARPARAG